MHFPLRYKQSKFGIVWCSTHGKPAVKPEFCNSLQQFFDLLYANKWMPNRIRKKGGKQRLVSDITRRLIKREVLNGSLRTAKEVHLKLEELGYSMSYQSAINALHSVEIFTEIKKKKPLLTAQHKKARLAWAKKLWNRRVISLD
ncbi:hypothetical protein G6F46_014539 [Rhizopus delemar]|uniref:Transposase Tc1-like domain-containing protein n=2 Tax=Rhizopus TaxID=4842 RepID=A0A9P6XWS6_9FUNG|nr:hypothetical protein G6F54_013218 [Rhizopus delemar]KAG1529213.1 hypothetical protein G6F51_014219 [Rhizopus arrhizus]KAG1488715.1 hypothetical protein G6F53_013534 [Rhizopus delemar]KAG1533559.1 hypothetical protein G6F49_013511 [Rhizopus delemar]KAG1533855.1 hypothetical protein G6F50_015729 [Rhizopus delemar]